MFKFFCKFILFVMFLTFFFFTYIIFSTIEMFGQFFREFLDTLLLEFLGQMDKFAQKEKDL